jgi:signal transduction histidine kinase
MANIFSKIRHKFLTILLFSILQFYAGFGQNNNEQVNKNLTEAKLALEIYDYEKAINAYNQALSLLSNQQSQYTQTLLELWQTSQEHNTFENDSIYYNWFNTCKVKGQNDIIKANCLYALSLSNGLKSEQAYQVLMNIKPMAEKSNNAFFYITLGTYYCYISDYSRATQMAFKALKFTKDNDFKTISHIYSNLSRYFLHQSLYNESLRYALMSIDIQNKHKMILFLPNNYEVLMYLKANEQSPMDTIIQYGEKAYSYAKKLGDNESQMFLLTNIATVSIDHDKNKAVQLMDEAEKLTSNKTSQIAKLHFKMYKGNFEMRNGNYEKAISIFEPLADEYKILSMNQAYSCYHYISYCYENLQDFQKALDYYGLYSTSKAEYESENSKKSLLASELKYESEKKDKTILQNKILLLEKENEAKIWSSLFKLKNSENKILDQNQKIAIQQNENLNNQMLLNAKTNKLKIAEKELDILYKDKLFNQAILISCLILILLASIFIYILWKKTKIQKNLENILHEGTERMIQAKTQLDDFTNFVQHDKAISSSHFHDIKNEFAMFEKTVSEVVNETKSFSFKISHEIQGPIKVIQNKLNNLSRYIDADKEKDLKEITEMTQKMHDVVEKLLLLSKIQKFDIEATTINISEQVQDIIDEMQEKYNKQVVFESKNILPIIADPLLLKIMWENLISNSIKYHKKENECRISLYSVRQKDKIIYTYEDNGSGMHHSFNQNTFSKNIGVDSNKIGLTLVQEIIKKHKGQFSIVNSDKLGTTFRIELNVA